MRYAFYVSTNKSGGEGKGYTKIEARTDRQTNLIGHTGRPTATHTANWIVIYLEKSPIGVLMRK